MLFLKYRYFPLKNPSVPFVIFVPFVVHAFEPEALFR